MIIQFLRLSEYALLPTKAHEGDACFDLCAAEDAWIDPNTTRVVGTGLAVELPRHTAGLVCSRSGLAAKDSVFVLNAPGVIDEGYRGEVKVILHNAGYRELRVKKGDRIAQLFIQPVLACKAEFVSTLDDTSERGEGGLGSTGT